MINLDLLDFDVTILCENEKCGEEATHRVAFTCCPDRPDAGSLLCIRCMEAIQQWVWENPRAFFTCKHAGQEQLVEVSFGLIPA